LLERTAVATSRNEKRVIRIIEHEIHEMHEKNQTERSAMADVIYKDESYEIMGACFEVYQILGRGFLEPVYQECLEIELADRGIPFVPQRNLSIVYKKRVLKQFYKVDFLCYGKIIIEVKAVTGLDDAHRSQVFNYLKATGMKLGILVNFGAHPKLDHHRVVL